MTSKKKKSRESKMDETANLIISSLAYQYFERDDDGTPPAIPAHFVPGRGKLVVVTGENSGGKSFYRRLLSEVIRRDKIEVIPISMEGRRNVAYNPMLSFVYGDESTHATGLNSIRTVTTGITTCRGRETPHAIIWDEPDIGLSEGNAASMGSTIAKFALDAPALTKVIVVITHRRALVAELVDATPHYLHLGGGAFSTLSDWLAAPPVIRELEDVLKSGHERFKAIQRILNRAKLAEQEERERNRNR